MAVPETERARENEWIERAQKGEHAAFGLLVERHRRRIFALIYHLIRQKDDVEDLCQDVFLKAFQGIRGYNFRSSFGTWLGRIAVNHCYDYLRRHRSARVRYFWQMPEGAQEKIEGERSAGGELEGEQRPAVRNLVSKLLERAPAPDRTIMVLKEVDGMSVEEIGEIMGLKIGTVKVRLHRARKRMIEDLKRLERGE